MSKRDDAVIDRCAAVARAIEARAAEEVEQWRVKHDVCAMTFAEHSRSMAGEIAVAILALKEEK